MDAVRVCWNSPQFCHKVKHNDATNDSKVNINMKRRAILNAFQASMVPCLIILALAPTPAWAQSLDGTYDVYWKGFRVFTLESKMVFADQDYRHDIALRSRGVLRLFLKAEGHISSDGQIIDGKVRPREFVSESTWNEDFYGRTVAYAPDGKATILRHIEPENSDGYWEPVPEELRVAPDPLSLFVSAVQNHWQLPTASDETPITFTSFDGPRAMVYHAHCLQQPEHLDRTKRSTYSGPAIRCNITGEQKAGFWVSTKDDQDKHRAEEEAEEAEEEARERGVKLWLAPTKDGQFMVPVRMELNSSRGKVKVYLSETKLQFN